MSQVQVPGTERIHVRAPATTANLGAGFDCAGLALDLWNELELVRDEAVPPADPHHLGIGAFARIAPVDGWRFDFTYRIPRSSGLGSSASLIAIGLVAGALAAGIEPDPEALLAEGLPLEGHPDNLAAALVGGATLTFDGRIERVADDVPARPIALRPDEQVATEHSRSLLPISVPHEDAAFSAGRAALLGAALASGSETLFAAALDDRLHEPYRSAFLAEVRGGLPGSALGATLSGSGPTVIVWARRDGAVDCLAELRRRWPDVRATPLDVSSRGAIP
jgi:homoserine kinase